MFCPRCRESYPDTVRFCPECSEALVPYARVRLELTAEEAREGGKKTVPFPGMFSPARISLIPGLKSGQTLSVRNARFTGEVGYETGVLDIRIEVTGPETDEAARAPETDETAPAKKKRGSAGGFWAYMAACLSVLPVTVLMTAALFRFSAREVFEAAGRDEVLVLVALSLGLLFLLRLTVSRRSDSARRNALVITVSLALAMAVRFVPPLLGIDLASAAGDLRASVYRACGVEMKSSAVAAQEPTAGYASATPRPAPATAAPPTGKSSVIPHFEQRYLLNRLSPEELENFTALYQSIAAFSHTCVFPHELSQASVDLLTTLILTECPELMQVDFTAGFYTLSLFDGKIRSMDIPYSMTRSEYEVKYGACYAIVRSAAESMRGMDIFEKEDCVYRLLVDSCDYSVVAPDASNAYGALVAGHAKCDGISLAAKWILEEAGETAAVLTGQEPGAAVGHAWNSVLINGVFCHLDITNDAENDGACLYPAFNVPEHCMTDVYPYDEVFASRFPLPSVRDYTYSYHYKKGCFIAAGESAQRLLLRKGKALYKEGGGSFTLQFERESDYRAFLNGLDAALSSLYYDTLGTAGRYAYNMLDNFLVVRITLSFS